MAFGEKTTEKEWLNIGKQIFRKEKWKRSAWANFQQKGDLLFSFSCMKVNKKNEVVIYLEFKPADIDLLFWEIVSLPENKQQPMSFRIIGAWVLKGCPIANWIEVIDPNKPELAFESVLQKVNQHIAKLEHITDLQTFINHLELQAEQTSIMPLLVTCLIRIDQLDKAMKLAETEISKKNSGGFSVSNTTYYQLARDEILKRQRLVKNSSKTSVFSKLFFGKSRK
ncbi:hypothetical protein [uncultured Fluviicola sp.]|uniref:hypothetical protein n=1 Tax=uncultured Fluviicola sp. TaxID=463303 RepID=UPI0025DCD36E|nr:hypothetical protein [uncultured Fluviicola sp.]